MGFRAKFAPHVKVDIRNDTAILRWARRYGYILVCHDKHRDNKTRLELYTEVYRNGGKIIRMGGGTDQDPLVELGRILLHLDEWREFFAENDGMVVVGKTGAKLCPSHTLYTKVQAALDTERVTGRKVIKPSRQRKTRRPQEPSAQMHLGINT